jgi:D-amino-acid dehydrogenase
VVVIGAGAVGLSTAWFLQRSGAEVCVIERKQIAAGASFGNAGWLTPSLVLPLAQPSLLSSGVQMMLSPRSPLYIPPALDAQLLRFLVGFARHCTSRRWRVAATALAQASSQMLAAYDEMHGARETPVAASITTAEPFLAAFCTEADRDVLVEELNRLGEIGFAQPYRVLDQTQTREADPLLSDAARFGLTLEDQRFIKPAAFVRAIGSSLTAGGGEILSDKTATAVTRHGSGVAVTFSDGSTATGDTAVIATGSWLGRLARQHGVRMIVQAGRGYSFTVYPDQLPRHPIYLPAQRVACTPLGGESDGLRLAGMMEFRRPDAPLDPRRIRAIVDAAAPMLTGIDWSARSDEWVGARPCTPDGLPLVGRTATDRVFVAGGHGMWGIALGPLTGKILAEQITGEWEDPLLRAFDPLRR